MENTQPNPLIGRIRTLQQFPDSEVLKATGVEDIFKSVMTSLKDAALEKVKEKATGWIMEMLGMGPGPDPLDEIKKQLEEQAAELKKINEKLDVMFQAITKALGEILDTVEKGQYDAAVRGLNLITGKITSRYDKLMLEVKTATPDPARKKAMADFAADIIKEVPEAFDAIHSTIVGTGAGEENLLDFWARLSFKYTGSIDAYEQKIFNQFMYYYGLQVKALMLVLEAYHTDPATIPMAEAYFNLWAGKMNDEILAYLKNAPRTTVKQQYTLRSTPTGILLHNNYVHYTTGGMTGGTPELVTVKKSDFSETDRQVPPESAWAYHMLKKGDYAYMTALRTTQDASWNFLKIKLGEKPQVEKEIACHSPGEGPMQFAIPMAVTSTDTTMYVMFSGMGISGVLLTAIDLETFSFSDSKGMYARKANVYQIGEFGGNGGVIHNNLFYTSAEILSPDIKTPNENVLFTVDLNKKTIETSTDLRVGYKGETGGVRRPMAIQGNYLYCSADDTWLRILDITNPLNPKMVASVDTGFHFSDLVVDGPLIYFTNSIGANIDADDRGNINVGFYTSRTLSLLTKNAKIGDGIHALALDKFLLYAGSGRDQNKMYVMSYANDLSKNIVPVPQVSR